MTGRTFAAGLALTTLLACGCGGNAPPQSLVGNNKTNDEAIEAAEQARRQRFEELLASGRVALEVKRFPDAIKNLEEATHLRDDPEARELLQQARKGACDQAMLRAAQHRKDRNFPAAVAAFREALNVLPSDREAKTALLEAEFQDYFEKGQTALKAENYGEAIRCLAEANARQPENPDVRERLKEAQTKRRAQVLAQGRAALDAKHYAEAVGCLTEAKALQSNEEVTSLLAEATFQHKRQLGRQQVELSQFALAIGNLEEAIRLKPDDLETGALLQRAWDGKKRQDKADYDRAMAAGDAALNNKDYRAAIKAYSEALAKQPGDEVATTKRARAEGAQVKKDAYDRHINQGKAHLTARNYPSAEAEFQAALSVFPNDAVAHGLLIQVQSLKVKKESYDRHINQGRTYLSLKSYGLAEFEFQAALGDINNDPVAQGLLTQAQTLKVKKESFDRHVTQGKTYLTLNSFGLAEMEFQAALRDIPNDPEAQKLLQMAKQKKK